MARELASKNFNLILVARSESVLKNLSEEIKKSFSVEVKFLVLDLSEQHSAKKLFDFVEQEKLNVQVLVNNAGYGLWGNFHELSLEEMNNMTQLNVTTLVELCYLFIPQLIKQKKAYILNVASTTAYQAIPTLGLYAAGKAFVVSFSRSLFHELKKTNISVTCVSPGTTRTGFVERSRMHHMEKLADKVAMEPEAVAKIAVRAMLKGKSEVVPGFMNWFSAGMVRILPKNMIEKIAASIYKVKK